MYVVCLRIMQRFSTKMAGASNANHMQSICRLYLQTLYADFMQVQACILTLAAVHADQFKKQIPRL